MYTHPTFFADYHNDRQRELARSMRNAQYDHARFAALLGKALNGVGSYLASLGRRLQLEQETAALELVPIARRPERRYSRQ